MKIYLKKYLKDKGYKKIISDELYIIAEGTLPVCLCAHVDTIGEEINYDNTSKISLYDQKEDIFHVISGCTLDDRLGIYIIINIIESGLRPSIIFTDLEESGGIGATKLVEDYPKCPLDIKFIIELDRQGEKDSVYYSCGNKEFQNYINSFGFNTAQGTFTDCLILGESWDIAAVNLSCGYQLEHTIYEYAHLEWTKNTENKVKIILKQNYSNIDIFKYNKEPSLIQSYTFNNFISKMTCILCDEEIKDEREALFYNDNNNFYCICHKCRQKYDINDD